MGPMQNNVAGLQGHWTFYKVSPLLIQPVQLEHGSGKTGSGYHYE